MSRVLAYTLDRYSIYTSEGEIELKVSCLLREKKAASDTMPSDESKPLIGRVSRCVRSGQFREVEIIAPSFSLLVTFNY